MYGIKGARRNGNMGADAADDAAVADAIGWPSISLCDVVSERVLPRLHGKFSPLELMVSAESCPAHLWAPFW